MNAQRQLDGAMRKYQFSWLLSQTEAQTQALFEALRARHERSYPGKPLPTMLASASSWARHIGGVRDGSSVYVDRWMRYLSLQSLHMDWLASATPGA